jgi:hypothetical protein
VLRIGAWAGLALVIGCSGEIDGAGPPRNNELGGAANMSAGRSGAGGGSGGSAAGTSGKGGTASTAGSTGSAGSAGSGPVCSGGQMQCGGACVDIQTSLAHCGGCDRACGTGQACSVGACTCSNGATACGTSCVDLQTDKAHCGTCTTSCSADQSCVAGSCRCPTGSTTCGTACVDVQASDAHCGGCNMPCSGGSRCMAGMCACPTGQKTCGGSCVDTNTSGSHCGDCNVACAMGQTCTAGLCTGAGSVGLDGCTGGPARAVTLSRIDAFQTVGIGIMEEGEEVATSQRNSDLVEGRETVLRIFVTTGTGFTARELSARVTLVNGTASEEFFTKKNVSGTSDEDEAGSTIQVTLPAEEVLAGTQYAVELVECGTPPTAEPAAPRFPATGSLALGARKTGLLKVTIIPITSNNRAPDTSEAGLAPYRELLEAIYPVAGVELTVGGGITAGYPVDWNGTLDAVRAKRQSDQPDADVYYYGLIKPTETFREFCGNGCTAGIGFVPQVQDTSRRVSMGIGFEGDQSPGAMAHEIGHNHGRNHAPCVPQGAQISGVDGQYPYSGGSIGVWGYDNRSSELINPDGITDMMGYCNNVWVSDYTYDGLLGRVVAVNEAKLRVNPDALGRFRVLLVDRAGARWGRPITELTPPAGVPELAEILGANGELLDEVTVYRTEVSDIDAASIMVPEPEPGWHAVKVSGVSAHPFAAAALGAAP